MATTPNFNWSTPDNTGLVKNGALDIRTLGNAIDASMADLKGGTTGQVLAKATNTDMDFTWVAQDDSNAIQNAIVDAKGDLIAATAADTPARLAVGGNGSTLVADSTASTGLKWDDGAWTTYTPTIYNGSLGNGTVTGRYRVTGKNCTVSITFTLGSTSTVAAYFGFGLPVTGKTTTLPQGWAYLGDAGTAEYAGLGLMTFSTIVGVFATVTNATYATITPITATVPHTWANTDIINLNITYEVA